MATTELEAASLRPGDIAGQRFNLAKRGYEAEEVQRFLQALAEYVGRLQGEIEWQRARVEHLEQRSLAAQESAYDRISREFMEVVRRADEAAGHVRSRAEDEARVVLNSAREEANRILAAAAGEAERVLLTARAEAERLMGEATRQVERLVRDAGVRHTPPLAPSAHVGREAESAMVWDDEGQSASPVDQEREAAIRRHPAGREAQGHLSRLPSAPGEDRPGPEFPEPAFAEFEEFNLEFDGSLFDLFGESGP